MCKQDDGRRTIASIVHRLLSTCFGQVTFREASYSISSAEASFPEGCRKAHLKSIAPYGSRGGVLIGCQLAHELAHAGPGTPEQPIGRGRRQAIGAAEGPDDRHFEEQS